MNPPLFFHIADCLGRGLFLPFFGAGLFVYAEQPVPQLSTADRIERSCRYLFPGKGGEHAVPLDTSGKPTSDSTQEAASSSCFPAESTVQRTFNGHTYTLHVFSGKYVQWEVPDSWLAPGAFTSTEIRDLVDITDILYAHYAELVQGEPSGSGLLSFTVNPEDMGTGGVGYIGAKGVTVSAGWVPAFKRDLHIGVTNGIIVHEMGHNFDIYNAYLEYYPDGVHAWTTVVQYYLPYYMRVGAYDFLEGPDDSLERWFRRTIGLWDAIGSSASWATCVRNGAGCETNGVTANDAWGGLVMRFARLHGTSAFRRVFDYLRDYKAAHPSPPATPEAKNDLLVLALAAGARTNISCELDTWHWQFSQTVRTQLANIYPGQSSFCVDADGDGYSPARGDSDDHNVSIHPGAIEVTSNGIDDDCDGVVDDALVAEQNDFPAEVFQAPRIGSIPLRVTGHASDSDQDAVRFRVGTSIHLKARLRSFEGFQGEFDIGSISENGAGWGIGGFTPNSVTNFDADVPVGADGLVVIKPASGSAGSYEIILDGAQPPPDNPVTLTTSGASSTGPLQINATSNTSRIAGETPTAVRFWANGVGFIRTLPIAAIVSTQWTPPSGFCGDGIRAQLLSGDHPISPATSLIPTVVNISTRAAVGTGNNVLIGGFIVSGEPQKVLIRALGPTLGLAPFNVPNTLNDPQVMLLDGTGKSIARNDNWQTTVVDGSTIIANQMADIQASGKAPPSGKESAIIATLAPGNYTAVITGANSSQGVALIEVYALPSGIPTNLINISTRGFVQTGNNVMIGGFIVSGQPQRVLIRALGPTLAQFGVANALTNPQLMLFNQANQLIARNDNWQTTMVDGTIITSGQMADIQNTHKAPPLTNESAIIATLPAGNYTAQVNGVNGTSGVGLIEVYTLP